LLQKCIISTLLVFSFAVCFATNKKPSHDSTTVIIQLNRIDILDHNAAIDSIYLVFDKFDHSGAGIVKQKFYPTDNTIRLTIPKGKYYVNIVCLGLFIGENFDRIINAKENKENIVSIKLREPALFTPGLAYIPEEKIDLSNLMVTRYKLPK